MGDESNDFSVQGSFQVDVMLNFICQFDWPQGVQIQHYSRMCL